MEVVPLDYTVLDKASNGLENALVITDIFSKWVVVVATKDQKASTVARVLVREWFPRFGPPLRIHSDRGHDFESKVVRSLCKMYGTSSPEPVVTDLKEMNSANGTIGLSMIYCGASPVIRRRNGQSTFKKSLMLTILLHIGVLVILPALWKGTQIKE